MTCAFIFFVYTSSSSVGMGKCPRSTASQLHQDFYRSSGLKLSFRPSTAVKQWLHPIGGFRKPQALGPAQSWRGFHRGYRWPTLTNAPDPWTHGAVIQYHPESVGRAQKLLCDVPDWSWLILIDLDWSWVPLSSSELEHANPIKSLWFSSCFLKCFPHVSWPPFGPRPDRICGSQRSWAKTWANTMVSPCSWDLKTSAPIQRISCSAGLRFSSRK